MVRWVQRLTTTVTLGAAVATAALWVRTYRHCDVIRYDRGFRGLEAQTLAGAVRWHWRTHNVRSPPTWSRRTQAPLLDDHLAWEWKGLGFAGGEGPTTLSGFSHGRSKTRVTSTYYVTTPLWAVSLLAWSLVAALRLAPALLRRRRRRGGRCGACGYDLRATPGRCPECGREQPPAAGGSRGGA